MDEPLHRPLGRDEWNGQSRQEMSDEYQIITGLGRDGGTDHSGVIIERCRRVTNGQIRRNHSMTKRLQFGR